MRVERLVVVVIWMSGCARIWSMAMMCGIRITVKALLLLAVKGKTES
jgi:hypothetical protein